MSNLENASLVLKSFDLPQVENNVGVKDLVNTSFTWKNIDLRTLLGTMYDKYDYFNLTLNTLASSQCRGLSVNFANNDSNQLSNIINISGLPWVNQTYKNAKGCNSGACVMGCYTFVPNQTSVQSYYSSNFATFSKNQDICSITITYANVYDGLSPITTQSFPEAVFIFDIFGIPKTECTLNISRLDNSNNLNTIF